jgi:parvulin-like peptidyl-prolyl isomerase
MHWKRTLLYIAFALSLRAQALDDPKKVVATVAGKDVTAAEIQKMLATFDAQMVQTFQRSPQDIVSRYFLILHLAEEAEKAKLIEKSPYKEQFEALRLQLLSNARVNEENNTFPVTPEAIEAYYKEHSAQYEQAKIKVIYISYGGPVVPTGTDRAALEAAAKGALAAAHAKRSEAEARTLAEDIVKQLRGGADFAKLVEQYSEDPASKAAHGDFGVIRSVGEYPAELKSVVFGLKPGEISEPFRQPAGFYVIRLDEKGTQPVEEVREPIVQVLRNEHMNQWMKEQSAAHQAVIKDPDFFKNAVPAPLLGVPSAAPPK